MAFVRVMVTAEGASRCGSHGGRSLSASCLYFTSLAVLMMVATFPEVVTQTTQTATEVSVRSASQTPEPAVSTGCPDPGKIINGTFSPPRGPHDIGVTVRYRCNAGNLLLGARRRVCTEVSSAAVRKPALDPLLLAALDDVNATMTMAPPTARPQPLPVQAEWSGSAPKCIVSTCGDPGVPQSGYRVGNSLAYSAVAQFGCHPGYLLSGNRVARCLHDGQMTRWTTGLPKCNPVTCPKPGPPSNSMLLDQTLENFTYTFGDSVNIVCREGYGFIGQHYGKDIAAMRCEADGSWSATAFVCQRIQCPDLGSLANGYFQYSKTYPSVGSIVTYGCGSMFELRGSVSRICQSNGLWSGNRTTCIRMSCSDLQQPANGRWSRLEAFVGEDVELTCDAGFMQSGSGRVQCGSDRRWYGIESECIADMSWGLFAVDPTVTGSPNSSLAQTSGGVEASGNSNVVFGIPIKIIIAVGSSVVALLLILVGLMWLRRWHRRRDIMPVTDVKLHHGDTVDCNSMAQDFDKTLMAILTGYDKPLSTTTTTSANNTIRSNNTFLGNNSAGASNSIPRVNSLSRPGYHQQQQQQQHTTSTTMCNSREPSGDCPSDLPPRPGCPAPPAEDDANMDELYDALGASPTAGLEVSKFRRLNGKLSFEPMDEASCNVLATPSEIEYDVPVLETCCETDSNIYDDALVVSNLYSEAGHNHIHVYDSADEGDYNAAADKLDLNDLHGIYSDLESMDPYYSAPPDLDEIYSDLAEEMTALDRRQRDVQTLSADEDYNQPLDYLPPPPEGMAPAVIASRPSHRQQQRRSSKAKSMVSDSFRRIMQNKRRRISVGSSYDAALQPAASYLTSQTSDASLSFPPPPPPQGPPPSSPPPKGPPPSSRPPPPQGPPPPAEEYKVPFETTQQLAQLREPDSDYHKPIDHVASPDDQSQHYYHQPADSLTRGKSPGDCLTKGASPPPRGMQPPPPPQQSAPVLESDLVPPSLAGLEYSCASVLARCPPKPPRGHLSSCSDTEGTATKTARESRLPTNPSTGGKAAPGDVVEAERRRGSKPAVAAKPRHAANKHLSTVSAKKPPHHVVADSGDVYSIPDKC